MRRAIFIIFGCISFVLGFVGTIVPVLPTTPFLLLSGFCFSRSSKVFDNWLKSTAVYRFYVEDYAKTRSIPREKKRKIILNVVILMIFSIWLAPIWWVKLGLALLTCGIVYVIGWRIADTPTDRNDE
ncbi:YbaN family protein [Aerococcaceae bacterium WGS1372]